MAKVNSKYFADIIAKFLESKRNEKIVVDEAFKNEFRVKFLARAAEISGVATVAADEVVAEDVSLRDELGALTSDDLRASDVRASDVLPDRAPIEWREVVRRFRYVLALVPSAFLVVFASGYVMNLPVEVGSEVVVPIVDDESYIDDTKPLFTSEDAEPMEEVREDDSLETSSVSTESLPSISTSIPIVNSTETLNDSVVPTMSADMFKPIGQQVQSQVVTVEQGKGLSVPQDSQEVQTQDRPMTVDSGALIISPQVPMPITQNVQPVTPQVVSPEAPEVVQMYVPLQAEPKYVPLVEEPQEESVSEVKAVPQAVPLSQPISVPVTVPTTVSNPQLNSTVLGGGSSSTAVKSAPVYYYTNLSDVEKENLEGQIGSTVDQTDVMEMHVYSLSGDVFEIVVRFNDGTSITKNLRKSGGSGSFDDVSSSVAEERAASEPVIVPPEGVIEVPPSIPSGYYGPIDYEVLLDYDMSR